MPAIMNPQASGANPDVITATAGALRTYAARALSTETPIVSPNTGHKAYTKRMNLARQAIANSEHFAPQAAVLLEQLSNGIPLESQNRSVTIYRYISEDNGSGVSMFDCEAGVFASVNNIGTTSGHSIFDVLAGVDQSDLQ